MEEELNVSAEYKQWFNRGYNLRKSMPEIFKGMDRPKEEPSSKMRAFDAGVKEFEREQARISLHQHINSSSRNKDMGRDI
ncbi:MAG: hypothetical protein R8G66_26030 [Cytophagales bacterium]|nr:hypothetical protein [Cytophagales bacterium]